MWFPSLHPRNLCPNTANKIRLFVKQLKISTFPVKAFWPSFALHSFARSISRAPPPASYEGEEGTGRGSSVSKHGEQQRQGCEGRAEEGNGGRRNNGGHVLESKRVSELYGCSRCCEPRVVARSMMPSKRQQPIESAQDQDPAVRAWYRDSFAEMGPARL